MLQEDNSELSSQAKMAVLMNELDSMSTALPLALLHNGHRIAIWNGTKADTITVSSISALLVHIFNSNDCTRRY